ncbi:hypothetical protein [Paenibacillus soyae]|uniref:Uncharacterized protein n=1 Tax=Paenibacillus soyae TaxID=2969249 RepID=A0A9X2MNQ0_9BACL|nr:hypothetical protein [Paenibacillus soyae]MCR2805333.1 hypothetical protein [Paenibacillus soyae]
MDKRDIVTTIGEIGRKVSAGEAITAEEVDRMAKVAAATGRTEHLVLYTNAKRVHREVPDKPAEPPKPEKVTKEAVEAARLKAVKSGRIEDRVQYASLKRDLAGASDE